MLPVIIAESQQFLAGNNPYGADYANVTGGPVYYLPLQWLFYAPLVALNLDPRLLNVAALAGTVTLFLGLIRGSERRMLYAGMLAGILAARPSIEMLTQGHVWPLWFLCTAFCTSVARGRPIAAAVLLGILLAASQTMLLVLALWAAHMMRSAGPVRAILLVAACTAVYLAVILPFAGLSPQFFLDLYLNLPQQAGIYSDVTGENPVTQVSLMNLLANLDLSAARGPLQVAAGLVGLAAMFRKDGGEAWYFLCVCGLSYVAAISLNMQVWNCARAEPAHQFTLLSDFRSPAPQVERTGSPGVQAGHSSGIPSHEHPSCHHPHPDPAGRRLWLA
jgi:hypothetical protein